MLFTGHPILVTGSAGFIGFHLCKKLLDEGFSVVGIDSLNDYYEVNLKQDRLSILKENVNFRFEKLDLTDEMGLRKLFSETKFEYVVNLAAQAGVRYSLTHPEVYINSNIVGFSNLIKLAKDGHCKHFIYASSSSVYGANKKMPFSVSDSVDHPVSLYAATKKSNELLAHSYSVNFDMATTGLRFFTVYGPWGRPDMALFLFTKAILEGRPIDVYNYGNMQRDFTYVEDIVEGVFRLLPKIPEKNKKWEPENSDPSSSFAPFRIFNIGNNEPVKLMDFIGAIEDELGIEAKKNLLPLQMGDVPNTYADSSQLIKVTGYTPNTSVKEGVKHFIDWYKEYYKVE